MNTSDFCQSLIATKGLLSEEEQDEWVGQMAHAMIVDAIKQAAIDGRNPREYVNLTCLMLVERGQEWLTAIEAPPSVKQ